MEKAAGLRGLRPALQGVAVDGSGVGWVQYSVVWLCPRKRRQGRRTPCGPSPGFSQVFILKGVKVLCFDTLLQVFILKVLTGHFIWPIAEPVRPPSKQNLLPTQRKIEEPASESGLYKNKKAASPIGLPQISGHSF